MYLHYIGPVETDAKVVDNIGSKQYTHTKQSNKRNNQNSKDKRQDYNSK